MAIKPAYQINQATSEGHEYQGIGAGDLRPMAAGQRSEEAGNRLAHTLGCLAWLHNRREGFFKGGTPQVDGGRLWR